MIEPRFRITCGRKFAFGPGKAALLEAIENTGSLVEAAKAMDMSYMRAWTLVKNMNGGVAGPLVESARGGRQHGGAKLTKKGSEVLQLYRKIETRAAKAAAGIEPELARCLGR